MIAHLVSSTLLLVIILAAASLLPITARTRHALLLVGLAKFAIPAAAFTALGMRTSFDASALPVRFFGGGVTMPAPVAAQIDWVVMAWAAIAALIFTRWLLTRMRLVTAAMRAGTPPSAREAATLEAARRAVGVRHAIDIIRSPLCEAPAVLRVIRPVIVLPAIGCDELADDELLALLCHEVAHVKRRDNLLGILEAVPGALLWFHPFVWLALHEVHVAREEACDETVADVTRATDTYLSALTKICGALIAPRVAGVSCIANAKLKGRIHHLMRYDTLRASALNHRGVIAIAAIALLAFTTGSALIAANRPAGEPYNITFRFTFEQDTYTCKVHSVEKATGHVVDTIITGSVGHWSESKSVNKDRAIEQRFRVMGNENREGIIQFTALDHGVEVQKATMMQTPNVTYTGEPISISLKGADIRDVMNTFGKITNMEVVIDPNVTGTVTVDVHDMPWDEALDMIAKQNGLNVRVEGHKIYVGK